MKREWTHSMCDTCWEEANPNRPATRLLDPSPDRCCECWATHTSGIFVRVDPENLACKGDHTPQ